MTDAEAIVRALLQVRNALLVTHRLEGEFKDDQELVDWLENEKLRNPR